MSVWSMEQMCFVYLHPRYDPSMLLKDTTSRQEFTIVLFNEFHVLDELLEETINEK